MSINLWKLGTLILGIFSIGALGIFIGRTTGKSENQTTKSEESRPLVTQSNAITPEIKSPSPKPSLTATTKPSSTTVPKPTPIAESNLPSVRKPNLPSGTYVSEKNDKYYIELKSDGTFFVKDKMLTTFGKYEIEGNVIILKSEIGLASKGRIEGNVLTDPDGDRWIKK